MKACKYRYKAYSESYGTSPNGTELGRSGIATLA